MGALSLKCIVAKGARLLAMSYTQRTTESIENPTHVVLIQSNPNPSSAVNFTWSLVSAWPRNLTLYDDSLHTICHVDPLTGVFTVMSNYTSMEYTKVYKAYPNTESSLPYIREPGGFQYDPRTDSWKDFTLEPGYRWGDVRPSFALFNWPNSNNSTVYQANIDQSAGAVNLGMLAQDSRVFVNVASWALNPLIYGYPVHVIAGQNTLYQFGQVVEDNRPGSVRTILTKIPLDSRLLQSPPVEPLHYNVTGFKACNTSTTIAKYYKESIYITCKTPAEYDPTEFLLIFDDTGGNLVELQPQEAEYMKTFQPFSNGQYSRPSMFYWSGIYQGDMYFSDESNQYLLNNSNNQVTIKEPYGDPSEGSGSSGYPPEESYPNNTPAITAGAVIGILIILGLVAFLLRRRYGAKFKTEIWPRWKRKIMRKIIEILETLRKYAENHEESGKKAWDKQLNKIEDGLAMDRFDSECTGKILVTPDMDLSGLIYHDGQQKQEAETEPGQYYEHYGSTDKAVLSSAAVQDGSDGREQVQEWSSVNSSSLSILPRAAPISQSQLLDTANDDTWSGEADVLEESPRAAPLTKKAVKPFDTMDELNLEQLNPPIPPITIYEPSAPPLDTISEDLRESDAGSRRTSS